MKRAIFVMCGLVLFGVASHSLGKAPSHQIRVSSVGLLVDDNDALALGNWKLSKTLRPFVGDGYRAGMLPSDATLQYKFRIPADGNYRVLASYSASGNRATNTLFLVPTRDGTKKVAVNQRLLPDGVNGFHLLGEFPLLAGELAVTISAEGANGSVIADSIWILTPEQYVAEKKNESTSVAVASNPPTSVPKKPEPPQSIDKKSRTIEEVTSAPAASVAPSFAQVVPSRPKVKLTSAQLDAMLEKEVGGIKNAKLVTDEQFLRRASLDIIGRAPTTDEMKNFADNTAADKRALETERLLSQAEFGRNWANYWSDVISFRVPQPELTFLNYNTFKAWLADELNGGKSWDSVAYQIVTASGKVGANPSATFIGFHQGDKSRLAAETSRIFLGVNISCAECHSHPFIDMPQSTFHQVAAFFVRTSAKLPHNNSDAIEVSSKAAGEHRIPGKKEEMQPAAFDSQRLELGTSDIERRTALAQWLVSPDNPWFAKAYANRIWARLMGRGFCEPVDEIGEEASPVLPTVHAAVTDHFIASSFDPRELIRLIVNTRAYQRGLSIDTEDDDDKPFAEAIAGKLRGDEVFDSLTAAIELPDSKGEQAKPNGVVRFPPPPKSTRDLVNDAFGFDPSLSKEYSARTMAQAMFMMNNDQLHKQLDARPESATMLARLLAEEKDDKQAIDRLYQRVLARHPREKELSIARKHLDSVKDRQAAFEDLLWSLINSAEFTTRR